MRIEEVFHVDSKHRKDLTQTTSNGYEWSIGKVIKNVSKIEVLYAEIPNSYYNVPLGRNYFRIQQIVSGTATIIRAAVTPGNYTTLTLPAAMQTAWASSAVNEDTGAAIVGNANVRFAINASTLKIEVSSTSSSVTGVVVPLTDGISYPFGLDNPNLTVNMNFAQGTPFTAGNSVRLASDTTIFLSIDELKGPRDSDVVLSPEGAGRVVSQKGIVGRFQMTSGPGEVNYFKDEFMVYAKHIPHSPPMHLHTLTVRWLNGFGDQIDFNGHDNSVLLRVTYDE